MNVTPYIAKESYLIIGIICTAISIIGSILLDRKKRREKNANTGILR